MVHGLKVIVIAILPVSTWNTLYIQVQWVLCTLPLLPRMAILKPSRLGHPARRQPDLRATSPTQPAIQFNDRLNDFTSAILHSILRQ